jgi:TP901 family phage tail tape measure protein
MAGRQDIEAGRAKVTIWADSQQLIKGLRAIQAKLQAFGSEIMNIGKAFVGLSAAITAPLAGAVAYFTNTGDALDEMSARTGVAVGALAELGYAAGLSGSSMEGVETGIKKMQKSLSAAKEGSTDMIKAFAHLGLSAGVLKTMATDKAFEKIAEAISKIQNPTEKANAAMKIFGKSGTSLIPMMDGLKAAREEARKLGIVPTEESTKMAAKMADAFDKIKATASAAFYEVGAALAPVLLPAAEAIVKISSAVIGWVRENAGLIQTVFMVGVGIGVAGAAIVALGAVIFGIGSVVGTVATIFSAFGSVLLFLVSPFGMIVVAVGATIAAFLQFTDIGQSTATIVSDAFTGLATTVSEVLGSAVDALLMGDLEAAANVLWAGLNLIWQENTQGLNKYWLGAKLFFLQTWQAATSALAGFFLDAYAVIRSGWAEAAAFIAQLWNSVTGGGADQAVVIEQKRQDAQKQIEKDRVGGKAVLNEDYEREMKALEDSYDKGVQQKRDALDKARAELSAVRKDIAVKKEQAAAGGGEYKPGGPAMPGAPDTSSAAAVGTFSASAAAAIGNGPGKKQEQLLAGIQKRLDLQLKEAEKLREKVGKGVAFAP